MDYLPSMNVYCVHKITSISYIIPQVRIYNIFKGPHSCSSFVVCRPVADCNRNTVTYTSSAQPISVRHHAGLSDLAYRLAELTRLTNENFSMGRKAIDQSNGLAVTTQYLYPFQSKIWWLQSPK
jgi:hypothetical protein